MNVRALLATLRRGEVPDPAALAEFAGGLADGRVTDAQAGAFAMAVCTGPGLGEGGRVTLTRAMADSGTRLNWDVQGPVIDKHSTGGVGDPVSLILAPALAACGGHVPMISGRGLGHTGGTLDKLEAIPGFRIDLSRDEIAARLADCGAAIVAATGQIAPADKRLYAVRDVTSTVDQIDLITASILSKKLAAGLDALILDVKCGSGAFMRSRAEARALAQVLTATGCGAGLPTAALVTDMDQPLAPAIGNAVEVAAVMRVLDGTHRDSRLQRVTAALGGALLHMAGLAPDADDGAARIDAAIEDGRALGIFAAMVAGQGGPRDFDTRWAEYLGTAPVRRDVSARDGGMLSAIDGTALGQAVVALGGGRLREDAAIDHSVGLDAIVPLGARLAPGDPICRIHAADDTAAERAEAAIRAAVTLSDGPPPDAPLILERLT
ncbi:thymidine phosphorylase [Palleronia sp. LCG004]|uniref:thymidine phosphorylase n=1 Tax=Palleronia sp. LCG004 TaxID=3079304 RepID=UPI002942EA1D|nr:thymidine phosphorylase [Palleronia sp. LCG004]WOI56599.1 thymidine phosphorylase [Palleronia sp. LCG004]